MTMAIMMAVVKWSFPYTPNANGPNKNVQMIDWPI